jgi:hypothetical protein
MKEELLTRLIEKTFERIACPLQGNGVYAEIQKAVMDAYRLGTKTQEEVLLDKLVPARES